MFDKNSHAYFTSKSLTWALDLSSKLWAFHASCRVSAAMTSLESYFQLLVRQPHLAELQTLYRWRASATPLLSMSAGSLAPSQIARNHHSWYCHWCWRYSSFDPSTVTDSVTTADSCAFNRLKGSCTWACPVVSASYHGVANRIAKGRCKSGHVYGKER